MLFFYTFCVYIGRHSKNHLIKILDIMCNSIHKKIKDYKLICYTNFPITEISPEINIEFREYYNKCNFNLYKNDKWRNLSFNKINIYKDLYDEFKKNFIWIDLDTIICYDISYINGLDNCFVENGGPTTKKQKLFKNNTLISVPVNKYIQGNFWKLNIILYNELIKTLKEILDQNLILNLDLQDLFNYHIYIKNKGNIKNINILGNNVEKKSINGLSVWDKGGHTHATVNGLNNMYIKDKNLVCKFYPDKEIHILSFTFYTLKYMLNNKKFKLLFK